MERSNSKKRKAVTRDVSAEVAVVSGDEFDFGQLDGTISESDVESEEEDKLGSDLSDEASESETSEKESVPKATTNGVRRKPVNVQVQVQQQNGASSDIESDDDRPNYRIMKDANGNDRYIYDEIDPGDDSDYSVPDAEANTIGDIPLSYYDTFPHIGYTINGKKIMRPATGEALDALLDSIDIPKGYTGLVDPSTGKPLELSQEELQLLRQVQQNEVAVDGYNPHEPTVEWFTSKTEIMPLSAAPEPKRRFVPSKHEQKRVMKIVKAIREGRIQPYRPQEEQEEEEDGVQNYDIWQDETPRPDHAMHMPAPKLPPPGFDESYHPPPEYLPDAKEKKQWEQADEEDREKEYLPTDYGSLRRVPGYDGFVKEKFERCLDLYLAPRVRRSKLNIDPESLLPKLPNPDDLRPFPVREANIFRGHKGRIRSVSIDPSGEFLATGGDDGTARVWRIPDTRQLWCATFSTETAVNAVRWQPGKDRLVLAVAAGDDIFLCAPVIHPGSITKIQTASEEVLDAGWGYAADSSTAQLKDTAWMRPSSTLQALGVVVRIPVRYTAKTLSFHAAGNHLVSVHPSSTVPASQAIQIHTISKHMTQLPFRKRIKGGGTPQTAHFHPTKPLLFVANQRVIRTYDLTTQKLIKIIEPGARWISSFSIHPTSASISGGDNVIVGSYDKRLLWMDLDYGVHPYKTLRYHSKAIRQVQFHSNISRYPLFADASDDGSIQIFHGLVTGDAMNHPTIVPLKVLKGHKIVGSDGLGVLDLAWHPTEPYLVSAGSDGTARLWVS